VSVNRAGPLGSGQAVRRLTLDQEIEGSNPSSPANTTTRRAVDGRTLTFESADDGATRDTQTGSTWTFEGRATAGELEGTQLELLVADSPFWFAWAVFRPDTRVWQP
jgi:hypothetical protein